MISSRGSEWARCTAPRLLAAGSLLMALACEPEGLGTSAADGLKPAHDSVSGIPLNVLSGKVAGEPFTMKDGRMRIDRREGYQKVDIVFRDSGATEQCGALTEQANSAVWLRFPGLVELKPGELQSAPSGGDFEAHLSVRQDGRWAGNGVAAGLLYVETFQPGALVSGALSVCFADSARSCVSGTFEAPDCPDHIGDPPRSFSSGGSEDIARVKAQLADAGKAGTGDAGTDAAGTVDGGSGVAGGDTGGQAPDSGKNGQED